MLSRPSTALLRRLTRPSTLFVASTSLALAYVAATPSLRPSFAPATLGSSNSRSMSSSHEYPLQKSDEDWRLQLSPEQFRILRQKGTEMAGTGEYDKHYPKQGVYKCAGCEQPLYTADSKFNSGCGWPAFFKAIPGAITEHVDRSWGTTRTEIVCSNCGGHQGHVFRGEGFTKENERHCVNSVSIKFDENMQASLDGKAKA
ncbi:hypothetical protein JCM10212_002113 [Sporobolomyces blumeae]